MTTEDKQPFEGEQAQPIQEPAHVVAPEEEAENLVETPNLETDTVVEVTREPVTPASLEGETAFEANPGVTPSPGSPNPEPYNTSATSTRFPRETGNESS